MPDLVLTKRTTDMQTTDNDLSIFTYSGEIKSKSAETDNILATASEADIQIVFVPGHKIGSYIDD